MNELTTLKNVCVLQNHSNDFVFVCIIVKIGDEGQIKKVFREFDITHRVVSRIWKAFQRIGMYIRRHMEDRLRISTAAGVYYPIGKNEPAHHLVKYKISFFLRRQMNSPQKM